MLKHQRALAACAFLPAILTIAAITLGGCTAGRHAAEPPPRWAFAPEMIFPSDRSLTRAEDGVLLDDGRLIVADQVYGLRLLRRDGSSRPFGDMPQAGYAHHPPAAEGAANGVSLEPGGAHILVADVIGGGIYRVDVATEATERVHLHRYGINTAVADRRGGIWFTQSSRNTPEQGNAGVFRTVDVPAAEGALLYLPPADAGADREATVIADGFAFANGIVLAEEAGVLYMAETMASRVWRFGVDTARGRVSNRAVALQVDHPDNLELDRFGRLWIACPLRGEIVVLDPATGRAAMVFSAATPASMRLNDEIERRLHDGEPWLDLMVPALWEPAPGLVTGVILPPTDDGPVYATGLGDALIRLER